MKKRTASIALAMLLFAGTAFAAEKNAPAPGARPGKAGTNVPGEKPAFEQPRRYRFEECDQDKDGGLALEEYFVCFPHGTREKFTAMDTNGDGKVTQGELRAWREANRDTYEKNRQKRRIAQFKRCDKNGDNMLSQEEFEECLSRPGDGKGRKGPGDRPKKREPAKAE